MTKYAELVGSWQGKTVAVLGLSFKPNTDDIREAPSLRIIPTLLEQGAQVRGYDPQALASAKKIIPSSEQLKYVETISDACDQVDVIFALIEWPEIIGFDYARVRTQGSQWIFDTRNQLNKQVLTDLGYHYIGVGKARL